MVKNRIMSVEVVPSFSKPEICWFRERDGERMSLEELNADGWRYVGPVVASKGLVMFERDTLKTPERKTQTPPTPSKKAHKPPEPNKNWELKDVRPLLPEDNLREEMELLPAKLATKNALRRSVVRTCNRRGTPVPTLDALMSEMVEDLARYGQSTYGNIGPKRTNELIDAWYQLTCTEPEEVGSE